MSGLPEGWISEELNELTIKIVDGSHNPPPSVDVGEPMLSARNIDGGRINFDNYRLINPEAFKREDARTAVAPDDVLLTIVGTIGRSAVVLQEHPRFVLQRSVAVLRPNASVTPQYLRHYLQAHETQQWMLERAKGTAQKGIYLGALAELPCLLPPIAEQRRIVAKLDALTARTARARDDLDRIPTRAARYKQAVLAAAFRGDLMPIPTTAKAARVEEVAVQMFDGPFGSNLKSDDYVESGVRVVRLENIAHLSFVEDKRTFISDEKFAALSRHSLQSDDVMFSSFVAEQVRVCVLPALDTPAINKADCFCIRVDRHRCDPRFLAFRLACQSTFKHFEGQVHGATRPRINLRQLKAFEFDLPPLDWQIEIVRRIERAYAEIDRLTTEAATARRLLDRLDQAVLAKAFRGELVPQDPADEPASVLLDRIRAERAAAPKSKRRLSPQAPATRKKTDMPKSRLDDDVKHQPFLASILKASGTPLSADSLFKSAGLPIAHFYKQLAWEIDNGLVAERGETLEAA